MAGIEIMGIRILMGISDDQMSHTTSVGILGAGYAGYTGHAGSGEGMIVTHISVGTQERRWMGMIVNM